MAYEDILCTVNNRRIVLSDDEGIVISSPNERITVSEDQKGNGYHNIRATKTRNCSIKVRIDTPDFKELLQVSKSDSAVPIYVETDTLQFSGNGMCSEPDLTQAVERSEVTFEFQVVNSELITK